MSSRKDYRDNYGEKFQKRSHSILVNQNSVNLNINNSNEFSKKDSLLVSPSQQTNSSLEERTIFVNPFSQSLSPNNNLIKRRSEKKKEISEKISLSIYKK